MRMTVPEMRAQAVTKDQLLSQGWVYKQIAHKWYWVSPEWRHPVETFDPALLQGTALTASEIKHQLKLSRKTALAPTMEAAGWRWVKRGMVRYWVHPSHVWDDLRALEGWDLLSSEEVRRLIGQPVLTRRLRAVLEKAGWRFGLVGRRWVWSRATSTTW